MPVMDGYAATIAIRELENKLIRDQGKKSYIVGLTGHCAEAYKTKCFESGMNYFSNIDIIL
jgi:CheY-like chemotaxis protein